ncbi:hypothetical protein [Neisseria dumasiana]|uniref:hypothetical protein n=1 Tax=Neisseria dumasiana TaxID=1931275 RepID=UPI000A18F098|nr:hypothetical protein [Neisseria dumasiana]OSI17119.1 hypothetical protein BV914_01325 [Neisseria dumasiana]
MTYFPTQLLRPRHAVLSGLPDDASLTVALHPFRWNEDCEEETEIRLDNIRLSSLQPQDLIGRSFQFPLNDAAATPTMPYIDGSIYLDEVHHPIDVTALVFQAAANGGVVVTITGVYCFECEGLDDYTDTPFTLTVSVGFTAQDDC